jgi:hypothetical protein
MKFQALTLALLLFVASDSQAILVRSFTANSAGPAGNPDANEFGGGAINLWTTSTTGSAGNFAGNSANNAGGSAAGAGNPAWGIWANTGGISTASASVTSLMARPLGLAGDAITLSLDNGFIVNGASVGVRLLNSGGSVLSTFSFTGGDSFYRITDGASSGFSTEVGFTGNGLNLTYNFTSSNGDYSLAVGSSTITGRDLALSSNTVATIEVFNSGAGGGSGGGNFDAYFNNLSLTAVPEVSPALALPLAAVVVTTLQTLTSRRRDSDD